MTGQLTADPSWVKRRYYHLSHINGERWRKQSSVRKGQKLPRSERLAGKSYQRPGNNRKSLKEPISSFGGRLKAEEQREGFAS